MNGRSPKDKILSYLGFARKSGCAAIGSSGVMAAVREKNGNTVVITASDCSERTKKQIRDKCESHGAPLLPDMFTGDEIARAVGSKMTVAAVAVTDRNLVTAILNTASDGAAQPNERNFPLESGKR